jgi:hypothetical protein
MKILILKGNAPRHNYFANEIKQLEGFDTLTLRHKRLSQSRLVKMIAKSPKTFKN